MYKKDLRKAFSANPRRKIFEIFTSAQTIVAHQGDAKLNKLPPCPKDSEYDTAWSCTFPTIH